jgi:hypothetical protein
MRADREQLRSARGGKRVRASIVAGRRHARRGLSRRRSRVRVPSLPSFKVPANRHYVLPMWTRPCASWPKSRGPNVQAKTPAKWRVMLVSLCSGRTNQIGSRAVTGPNRGWEIDLATSAVAATADACASRRFAASNSAERGTPSSPDGRVQRTGADADERARQAPRRRSSCCSHRAASPPPPQPV